MHTFHKYTNLPETCKNSVLAIGNFDGVHKGHQFLLKTAKDLARQEKRTFNVLTFEPHPAQAFSTMNNNFRLTPIRSKIRILQDIGVDNLIIIHFITDFYYKTAEQFAEEILFQSLQASTVIVGQDYHFGKDRTGNIETLTNLGKKYGFKVLVVDDLLNGKKKRYSSSICRSLLTLGQIEKLNDTLGHSWEFEARVIKGKKLGHQLGFPTANLNPFSCAMPRMGVYAALIGIPDTSKDIKWNKGIMNYGNRPTVDGKCPMLEAHIFDFDKNLYGQRIIVRPLTFIRPEIKFKNLKDLQQGVYKDIIYARNWFNKHKNKVY